MIKYITLLLVAVLLTSCGKKTYSWRVERVPTTDEERQMVKEHVEVMLTKITPSHLSGSDQDLEDLVIEAHREARESFCKPTMWEYESNSAIGHPSKTGRWKYAEEVTSE